MSIAEDLEAQTKMYNELDVVIDNSWKHVLELIDGIKLYSISYAIEAAGPILKKYGLEGLIVILDVAAGTRACKFYYNDLWVKPKCHYVPDGEAIPLFTILKEALKQKTAEPDIREIEKVYWAEQKTETEPKPSSVACKITDPEEDVKAAELDPCEPLPVEQKPLMQRFMGLMPSSEIKKRHLWSDGTGKHCTVEAGPNGWTIIFADAGTQYKDAAIGTDANYTEASKRMLKLFPRAKELPCRKCKPNKVTKKH